MKQKIKLASAIIVIALLFIGLFAFMMYQNKKILLLEKNIIGTMVFLDKSEWRCAGNTCDEWVTGDEWVKDNCNVGENNEMVCRITIGGLNVGGIRIGGTTVIYPLSKLGDISERRSCRTPVCGGQILIKNLVGGN